VRHTGSGRAARSRDWTTDRASRSCQLRIRAKPGPWRPNVRLQLALRRGDRSAAAATQSGRTTPIAAVDAQDVCGQPWPAVRRNDLSHRGYRARRGHPDRRPGDRRGQRRVRRDRLQPAWRRRSGRVRGRLRVGWRRRWPGVALANVLRPLLGRPARRPSCFTLAGHDPVARRLLGEALE